MSAVDENTLPSAFKQGLAAIRARHYPDARVVAVHDNHAYVALGPEELGDRYTVSTAQLFARVPLTFPNALPYGVVTHPIVQRADGKVIERFHPKHANCEPVAKALGLSDLAFWSWEWKGMPTKNADDMAHVVEWARKCVRTG